MAADAVAWMDQVQINEHQPSSNDISKEWERLNDSISSPVISINKNRRRWLISAAAAVLLLVAGFTFFKLSQSKDAIKTDFGQIASNCLPDGTIMILNANSTARLSEDWEDGSDREVWLDGEAFFQVTKTQQKSRFIVHTENLDVIVTGTQFNVQHRDNKTSVLLTEGSVIIHTRDGRELSMKPGDYIEMFDKSFERKEGKPDNVLAWKENMLFFENTPLRDAAKIIEHHYGVKVTLADEQVATQTITGFMSNNSLEDLLKAIEFVTSVRVTRKDNEIIFSAQN